MSVLERPARESGRQPVLHDLAVILVAHDADRWLAACLESVLTHTGECSVEITVVNNAEDGTRRILAERFPSVRLIRCENRGFAHANNRALLSCDARYLLLLNVDTEILSGTLAELVAALDARPAVGIAGVRQVGADGAIAPTIRRFPNVVRALCEAIGFERLPLHGSWTGERELRSQVYGVEVPCDWSSGSFLVVRREVFKAVGLMDERFFLYSEEPDLCLRARKAGWEVWHLPVLEVLHHAGKAGVDSRLAAQDAYSRLQFARKHFSPVHRLTYASALGLGYGLRAALPGKVWSARRRAAKSAFRTLVGLDPPPYGPPPLTALAADDGGQQ